MKFYIIKPLLYCLFIFLVYGCSKSDDDSPKTVSIKITSFEGSSNEVKMAWEVNIPPNTIITNLYISRYSSDEDATDSNRYVIVANLPSNETSYTDVDIPYFTNLQYTIRLTYYIDGEENIENISIDSETMVFEQDIVKFDIIPSHIEKDPADNNIFHIKSRNQDHHLFRYNSITNKVESSMPISPFLAYYNDFVFYENEIFLLDGLDEVLRINPLDYSKTNKYSLQVEDEVRAFTVGDDKIYYHDDYIRRYFDLKNNTIVSSSIILYADDMYALNDNKFLLLNNGGSIQIYDYSSFNDPQLLIETDYNIGLTDNDIDENIFTWNNDKSQVITSIEGRVFNMNDLSIEKVLKDDTGKNYFRFAYGNDGKLYGTVQGEKLIHVFNENYELIDAIETKLYPLFPLITENSIKCLGRYLRIEYWGPGIDISTFGNTPNCAIESFD